jgi:hypothetical protein
VEILQVSFPSIITIIRVTNPVLKKTGIPALSIEELDEGVVRLWMVMLIVKNAAPKLKTIGGIV